MAGKIIYLDYAAATPLDSKVLKAMLPYFSDEFYNPSSPYAPAVKVRHDYEGAKQQIASLIGAKSSEIIITAGATESINLAFKSVSGHVITSAVEHPAVINNAKTTDHTVINVDHTGMVDLDSLKKAIKNDTELISIGLANSEIGTIQPIAEIAAIVKLERINRLKNGNKRPIYLHCDASQGLGQVDVHVSRLGVDMLTLNAAKIYGPKQVGLLWADSQVKLQPVVVGGGQERGLRSGTENVAGVIGFAKALELAIKHRDSELDRITKLRDRLQDKLLNHFNKIVISGNQKKRLASHLNVAFPGLDGERLVFLLENRGVMVATGSACAANKGLRSHVLQVIGLDDETVDGSLRVTLGKQSTEKTIDQAASIIIEEVEREYLRVGK